MTDIKKLNKTRGAIQHRVTNIKKFFDNQKEGELFDVVALENLLESLETSYKEFYAIHSEILNEIDDDDYEETLAAAVDKGDQFQELYYEVKFLLSKSIKSLSSSFRGHAGETVGSHHSVKLPTIILPTLRSFIV